VLARAAPALLGLFWGAPLFAREFETGTYRLAWTQSVPRTRWVLSKLALGGLATATLAGVLTLTITWWYTSRDQVGGANMYAVFDRRDVAPVAYAVFAFTSGALLGALIRRTVPAMAATLGLFVVARAAVGAWVRPHLIAPLHETLAFPSAGVSLGLGRSNGGPLRVFVQADGPPRSWALSSHLVSLAGHPLSSSQAAAFVHQHCPNVGLPPAPAPGGNVAGAIGPAAGRDCLAQVSRSFHVVVSYEPASRYWTFQWLETGIFAVLALVAAIGCYWWVTKRAH
jgi:hypothetical protein